MSSENTGVEDSLHKARVAYRIGAKVEDISDYTGLDEEFVRGYIDDQDLGEQDRVSYNVEGVVNAGSGKSLSDAQDQISEMALEVVERVYDEWRNLEELPYSVRNVRVDNRFGGNINLVERNIRQIANVLGEEEFGEEYRFERELDNVGLMSHRTHHNSEKNVAETSEDIPEDHPEDSINTLLKSQRYVAPGDDQTKTELYTESIEWFIDRRGGSASEDEIAEFLEFVMNYDPGVPTGRKVEEFVSKSENIRNFGTVTGGGERFSRGDRIYQTSSEPEIDEGWEELLEGTMERIEQELEGGITSRSKKEVLPDTEKLVGAD